MMTIFKTNKKLKGKYRKAPDGIASEALQIKTFEFVLNGYCDKKS